MKSIYLLLFLFSFNAYSSFNDIPVLVIEKIDKYDFSPDNSFRIDVTDSENIIVEAENLASLKGLKIHHIDLVYMAYQGKKTHNQNAINKSRIDQLKKAFPQAANDDPTWKCIEQTGATSNKDAKTFFQGFVVHYGPALDYKHLKEFFAPFQAPAKTFTVNSDEGGKFDCGDGTLVKIGGNTVTHADGSPVEGEYTLEYKEFKNPADIVFSGIPMTYNYGRRSMNFSSVGMYDLRAVQDGKSLKMSSPASVDFNCTKPETGVGFYQMDDNSGEWTKKKDIAYRGPLKLKSKFQATLELDDIQFVLDADIYNHHTVIGFNEECWDWVFKHFATHPELNGVLEKIDEEGRSAQLTVEPDKFTEMIADIVMEEKMEEMKREMEREIALREQRQKEWEEKERQRIADERAKVEKIRAENEKFANTLREGADNVVQSSPALVSGLSSPDFGVYNCDQIYQMQQPLVLSPSYLDENGKEIRSKHVVCVMDLNFNGSFNFHPNNITCNGTGKNVVLLFTDNKDVYMLSEEKFNQLDLKENFRPKFQMKNMTGVIKTSDDLKKYLKI